MRVPPGSTGARPRPSRMFGSKGKEVIPLLRKATLLLIALVLLGAQAASAGKLDKPGKGFADGNRVSEKQDRGFADGN